MIDPKDISPIGLPQPDAPSPIAIRLSGSRTLSWRTTLARSSGLIGLIEKELARTLPAADITAEVSTQDPRG
jgi:hypothetical protein